MNRLAIGHRLAVAFGLMLLITGLIAGLGIWRMGTLKDATVHIATTEMARSALAQRWKAGIHLNWQRASAALKTNDAAYIDALQKDMAATTKDISELQKSLEALLQDSTGQSLMAEVARQRGIYVQARAALLASQKSGQNVSAAVDSDLAPLARNYLAALDAVTRHADALLSQTQSETAALTTASQWTLGAGRRGGAGRQPAAEPVRGPVDHRPGAGGRRCRRAIRSGDLSSPIHSRGNDETAQSAAGAGEHAHQPGADRAACPAECRQRGHRQHRDLAGQP
jgi:methyl-accepting chemotaxis protein